MRDKLASDCALLLDLFVLCMWRRILLCSFWVWVIPTL